MSGPVATVLIPEPLSDLDRDDIRATVDSISDHELDKPPAPDAFWVCDTGRVGGRYSGEGRPFAIETGLQPYWESGQLEAMAQAFGFDPRDELVVIAFCNGSEDHRILGELCLWLAERFGGAVCFGGALWPGAPAGIDILDAEWRQVEPHFRRMVAGMPGRVVGLRCELSRWPVHVGDATFLRAWLENPRFGMVK